MAFFFLIRSLQIVAEYFQVVVFVGGLAKRGAELSIIITWMQSTVENQRINNHE